MEYLREILKLSFPLKEQVDRFIDHIVSVHSWYKRLPLNNGAPFLVFLEPDLNRKYYPNRQITQGYGDTKEEYEKAFGNLSYMWFENGQWNQDYGICRTNIPIDYMNRWTFKLYPYCHYDFQEAISLFETDFEEMEKGIPYLHSDLLVEWREAMIVRDDYWQNNLDDLERDLIVSIDDKIDSDTTRDMFSSTVYKYIQLENKVGDVENLLRKYEIDKIENSIRKLTSDFEKIKKTFANSSHI